MKWVGMVVVAGGVVWGGLMVVHWRNLSALDLNRINTRRGYFPSGVGRVYENKLTEAGLVVRKQVFSYLDWPRLLWRGK